MNCIVITKCVECADWTPSDSYGGGVRCDELGYKVSDDVEAPIPDCCPRMLQTELDELTPVQHTNDIIALCIYMADCIKTDGVAKIEKHTGWAHIIESVAQQRHL